MKRLSVPIIVLAYNTGQFIEKCLKSIQDQTYKNIQIIVIDDMSSDNTVSIIKSMQAKDNRIILIQLEKMTDLRLQDKRG